MKIGFNEISRRYAVIQKCDSKATNDDVNDIVLASIGMTDSEFDAVVLQAKVDVVVQKALAPAPVETKETQKSSADITLEILKAKYAKGAK